jgi:hypothetical protein
MAVRVKSGTTGTAVANTVVLTGQYPDVEIVNLGTVPIYACTDGSTPTIAGDDCDVIPATSSATIPVNVTNDDQGAWPAVANAGTSVQLISSAACAYTVTGQN